MKISLRLVLLATTAVALSVILTANMFWQDYQQNRYFERLEASTQVQTSIEAIRVQLRQYARNPDVGPLHHSRQLYEQLDQMFANAPQASDQQLIFLHSLRKRNNSVCKLLDQMIIIHDADNSRSQSAALTHLSNLLDTVIQTMQEDSVRLEQLVISSSRELQSQSYLLSGGLILTLAFLLSGLSLHTARMFNSRVELLDQGIQRLSDGDLNSHISLYAKDELSSVAQHFNGMIDRLRDTTISRDELQSEVDKRTQEMEQQQQVLRQLADHDELTRLPNRSYFRDTLCSTIQKGLRSGQNTALLFLDLDKFKQINDTLGHNTGDKVLQEAARRFRNSLRSSDFLARLGGDEFTIIINPLDSSQSAATVASHLIEAMKEPMLIDHHELHLGSSIGISLFPQDGHDVSALMRNADLAMYQSKEQGGNRFSFYSEQMTQEAQRKLVLEEELRTALQQQQLTVFYQPQYDLHNEKLVGVEALVRWNHPVEGIIPPMEFIPLAEERALIHELGLQVLTQSCTQCAQWLQEHFDPGVLAVNISARQLSHQDMPEQIDEILQKTGWPAHKLELEVTESFFINDTKNSLGVLNQLRDMGIKLAIDDFGTGYSSLAYLKQLPISKLKIDRSFTQDLIEDAEDRAISEAIIALGKTLGLQVIAEGVEQEGQAEILISEGCDQAQGFLYGRPMSAELFGKKVLANEQAESLY